MGRIRTAVIVFFLGCMCWPTFCGAGDKKPVAYWNFNEGSGQIVHDAVGKNNGYLGTVPESDKFDPKWVKVSEGNYALEFDNIKEKNFVLIGKGNGEFDIKKGKGFCVSLWIKSSGLRKSGGDKKIGQNTYHLPYYIISKHMISSPHGGWNISISPQQTGFSIRCEDVFDESSAIPFIANTTEVPEVVNAVCNTSLQDKQWHHIFAVSKVENYDDFIAEVKLYVDGIKVVENSTKNPIPSWPDSGDANLLIGVDQMVYQTFLEDPTWSTGFSGLLDEIKIFNSEINDDDVKKEYESSYASYKK